MKNYVITIARGFGSGGKDIAVRLAKRLGIPCYEREILDMAAEQTGLNVGVFHDVDERLRSSSILKRMKTVQSDYIIVPSNEGFISDDNLFNIQARIILTLATKQSCVIVGKCADYILREFPNVISIYIEAPRAYCVKSITEKMQVTEKEAHKLIKSTDTYRANYYHYYSRGGDWTNPTNYDLVLNTDKVGREHCVDVIQNYAGIRFPQILSKDAVT